MLKNERGVTLIEAIAALTLISIVFISFASFFVQSAKFNTTNDSNIQAANLVREYIAIYSNPKTPKSWENLSQGFIEDSSNRGKFIKTEVKDGFTIQITLTKEKEAGNLYRELRKVHVAAWEGSKVDKPLSDSYTFHEGVKNNN